MNADYDIASYQYALDAHHIAQVPAKRREDSRLLVLDCGSRRMQDMRFADIAAFFAAGDLLVVNDTKVFPARLAGRKATGGKIELFLLEYPDFHKESATGGGASGSDSGKLRSIAVSALLKSSKKPKPGTRFFFNPELEAELLQDLADGKVQVRLHFDLSRGASPEEILAASGRIPLPPYIQRDVEDFPEDRERYQTVFAEKNGAVAAPTAGLHFSESVLAGLVKKQVKVAPVTLHVGYGTFAPVRVKDIRKHRIHEEYVEVGAETAALINRTREAGGRIWTVGTTTARALEFAAVKTGSVQARQGWCGLYIYPGYRFKIVNNLITNFHLPGSSLLFLVAALAGRDLILSAYKRAIRLDYRFYSYGDAMLIIC